MVKKNLIFLLLNIVVYSTALAQPATREELERQRQQLKKEIEQTEKLLKESRAKTKESYVTWKLTTDKLNIQDRIIDNINKDIDLLDGNIYTIQKDIKKYDKLLDTLKQEYAKSMVYAYKNRSNYDFLNFIFSAQSFNDALRRVAYLKSYRTYREMQGENILRTQELRKKRIEELTGVKVKKSVVLDSKNKEVGILEKQKLEQDRILNELKKNESVINAQYAARKKQMQKVSIAITAAIEKAKKEAIAKAAAEEKRKQEEAKRLNALRNKPNINKPNVGISKPNVTGPNVDVSSTKTIKPSSSGTTGAATTSTTTTSTSPTAGTTVRKEPATNVLLNAENISLNASFEKNRGALPWPVDRGYVLMHFGNNKLPSGAVINQKYLTLGTDIGASVKAIFDGVVSSVFSVEDMQVVMIQHGKYFTSYSNLSNVAVQKGQQIKMGQTLGRAMANFDGVGAVDLIMSNDKNDFDPEAWLRRR